MVKIYLAEDIHTKVQVAIKTELKNSPFPLVIYEANVTLQLLQKLEIDPEDSKIYNDVTGLAKVYSYGQ